MAKPLVAIVGRPNVGKSTLINRLAAGRRAIVDATSGVTRDRNYIEADWSGREFVLIDTGGIESEIRLPLQQAIKEQALSAIAEADIILFLVDAQTGAVAGDDEIAKILRQSNKPVLLVANKVDNPDATEAKFAFFALGMDEPCLISASHGLGIGDLLDDVVEKMPPMAEPVPSDEAKIAIVGRPNVGKSSILNRLVGKDRVVVSDVPGTTRDAIDIIARWDGRSYRFVDTAGLRKVSKLSGALEYYGTLRAVRALEEADIALVIIDSSVGVTEQDQRIAALTGEKRCAAIIVLNKWDLIPDEQAADELMNAVSRKLQFIDWALLLKTSALTGRGLKKIHRAVDVTLENYHAEMSTSELNRFLVELKAGFLPAKAGKSLKLKYITQLRTAPPAFLFFVNDPKFVDNAYKRYLDKRFRERFGLKGTPINFYFRKENK